MPQKEVHVESGSFRVARERALEVLAHRRLEEPALFVLPLFRWAVAGKPTAVRMARGGKDWDFELRCDAAPLAEEELRDPYAPLFEGSRAKDDRGRELAVALLSIRGLEPDWVLLRSGEGEARRELALERDREHPPAPCPDGETGTVLRVRWGRDTPADWHRYLQPGLFSMSPVPVWIDGEAAPRVPAGEATPGLRFASGGTRGWLTLPFEDAKPPIKSVLQLYKRGAFVAPVELPTPLAGLQGHVNDDRLTLTTSLTGVVNNARLKAVLEAVTGRQEALLLWGASQLKRRMPQAARTLRLEGYAAYWSEEQFGRLGPGYGRPARLKDDALLEVVVRGLRMFAGLPVDSQEEARELVWTARLAFWVRDACRRLLQGWLKDRNDRLRKALWEAPLFLGAGGGALSLRDIVERQAQGAVLIAREAAEGAPRDAVWCVHPAEEKALRGLLGKLGGGVKVEVWKP